MLFFSDKFLISSVKSSGAVLLFIDWDQSGKCISSAVYGMSSPDAAFVICSFLCDEPADPGDGREGFQRLHEGIQNGCVPEV